MCRVYDAMNLTIIIPIKYRWKTLRRCLEYYKDFSGKIIVADSTPEKPSPFSLECDKYLDRHNKGKFDYWWNETWNYCEKIDQILDKVDTDYTLITCDDDFTLLPAIPKCLEFLDENPDYVAVNGHGAALYENTLDYETVEYLVESIYQNSYHNPLERIRHHWNTFSAKNHNIIKTEVQREIHKFHIKYPGIWGLRYFDKVLGLILALRGKIYTIPEFFQIRSLEPSTKINFTADKTANDIPFKPNFLNLDLTPLINLINEEHFDSKDLKELALNIGSHKNLIFKEHYANASLRCKNLKVKGYKIQPQRLNKMKQFARCENPQDLFPIFKPKYQKEIAKILKIVKKYK